jgi:translation initiation factor 2 gamma subunit (eIF-2gamma)
MVYQEITINITLTTDFDGNWYPKCNDNVCLQIGNINTEAILIELDENKFKFKLSKPVCIPNNTLIIVCSNNNEIKIVGFGKLD